MQALRTRECVIQRSFQGCFDSKERAAEREDAGPKDIDMCTHPLIRSHTHTACLLYHLWNMSMNIHNSPYTIFVDRALLPRKHRVCVCVWLSRLRDQVQDCQAACESSLGAFSLTDLPLVFLAYVCV